jgi:hypothetical protein
MILKSEKRKVGGSTPPLTTSEQRKRWLDHLCRPGLLTLANRSPDGLGEDGPGTGGVFAQHVGGDAQGHRWVGVTEPGGDDVDGNPGEKQCGRVQVT